MAKLNQNGVDVGDKTVLLLVGGGLAFAYFAIIKPMKDAAAAALEKLGFKDSELDKAQAKAIAASDKVNGWNPTYYKIVGKTKNIYLATQATMDGLAKIVYEARGGWKNDNEEAVYGAIRRCPSKAHLSQLADRFQALYKEDLLGYLKSFLSAEDHFYSSNEMATVATIVLSMPDYLEVPKTTKKK